MKGSRRKQSKPSRMACLEGESEENGVPATNHVEKMEVNDSEKLLSPEDKSSIAMETTDPADVGCPYCGILQPNVIEMKSHILSKHADVDKLVESGENFPTAYHRLASELTHGANMGQDVEAGSDAPPNDNHNSSEKEESSVDKDTNMEDEKIPAGLEGVVKNGSRIFHEDAYCDLCDREFCNKYFLKTHRANKHGMYDSPPTFPTGSAGLAFPEFSMKQLDISNAISKHLLKEKMNESLTKAINSDLEDFCEICQKHFCNKYYLRKHKADVHGQRSDSITSSRSLTTSDNQPSVASTAGSSATTPTSAAVTAPNGINGMANLLYLNPFLPPMALLPAQSLLPTQFAFLPNQTAASSLSSSSVPPSLVTSSSLPSNALRSIGVLNADAYCEICRKEFCNKYFLKIHKANKHGMYEDSGKNCSLPGSAPSTPPTLQPNSLPSSNSAPRPPILNTPKVDPDEPENLSLKKESPPSPVDDGLGHSSLMLTSRGIDRLACDICNKEVSSKYVLKIHKFKYHGIGTFTDLDPKNEESKENTPSAEALVMLENSPSDSELTKMGIDPEAYCKICKKEFCSKYFLRTHLFNMHGIRTEAADKRISSNTTSSKMTTHSPLGPGGERHTWRWKEPANMTRVFCDLCNKELCNKYFLRTHKLNKHGIYMDDPASPRHNVSAMLSNHQSLMNTNSNMSMKSNESNDSGEAKRIKQENVSQDIPSPQGNEESQALQQYLSQLSEACHLCDRRFKSRQWLELHLRNDHGLFSERSETSSPTASEQAMLSSSGSFVRACDLCGMIFRAENEYTSHMLEEHKDAMETESMFENENNVLRDLSFQLKRRYMKSAKQKLYSCSHCDYKTRWLSNVYSHEQRKHNTTSHQHLKKFTCKECLRSFSYEHSLMRHMAEYHSLKEMHPRVEGTKKFRCAHCGERFGSRVLCLTHIRIVHRLNPKVKTTNGNGITEKNLEKHNLSKPKMYHCPRCNFNSKIYRNLRMHIMLKHKSGRLSKHKKSEDGDAPVTRAMPFNYTEETSFVMQAFNLKEELSDGNFVTSTVYLPVKKKLTEARTVSFCLTPT